MDALAMDLAARIELEEMGLSPLRDGEPPTRLTGETTIAGIGFVADAIQLRREPGGLQVPVDPRDEVDLDRFIAAASSDGGFTTLRIPGFGERRYALFLFPFDE